MSVASVRPTTDPTTPATGAAGTNQAPATTGSPVAEATAAASLASKAQGCLAQADARRAASDPLANSAPQQSSEEKETPGKTKDNRKDYLHDLDKAYEADDD